VLGPVLAGRVGLVRGAYRLGKRQVQQLARDLSAMSISTGMVSKLDRRSSAVLEAPYNELAVSIHRAEDVHIDETSWREDRRRAWLWATVTRLATVLTIAGSRAGTVAKALLGSRPDQFGRERPVHRL
jgi:transposase